MSDDAPGWTTGHVEHEDITEREPAPLRAPIDQLK
jgi:hypothetical protein